MTKFWWVPTVSFISLGGRREERGLEEVKPGGLELEGCLGMESFFEVLTGEKPPGRENRRGKRFVFPLPLQQESISH